MPLCRNLTPSTLDTPTASCLLRRVRRRCLVAMVWASPCLAVGLLLSGSELLAEDWPQWRGPRRDGTWRAERITSSFADHPPQLVWRSPVSAGYSGPTVSDGRVFVSDRVLEPAEIERVHCFDFASGEHVWTHRYPAVYGKIGYQAGPRAAVTIEGDRAYSLGATGRLFCLSASRGKVIWDRDLDADYAISAPGDQDRMPIWGIAASPLLAGDRLVLHIGGRRGACVVALNKHTGAEIWRALDDRAQYAAPILIEQAGQQVVVVWTGDSVAGLDVGTGEVLWRHEMTPVNMPIGVATPIFQDGLLFVSSFYDGALMLQLDDATTQAHALWRLRGNSERDTQGLHAMISTPLFLGSHVYGVDSYGELRCLEAATGQRVWEDLTATPKARWSTIHMTRRGNDVWMLNERGELILATLSPERFEERGRVKLLRPTLAQLRRRDGVCWAHPAFAEGHIVLRNDEELLCYDLRVPE